MNCREFVEFLMEYLDGGLNDAERSVFEGHIDACPQCVNYLDSYRETVRLGQTVCESEDQVPDSVPDDLVRAILAARNA